MHQRLALLKHAGLSPDVAGKLRYRDFLVHEAHAEYNARVADLRAQLDRYQMGLLTSMGDGKAIQKAISDTERAIAREEAAFYAKVPREVYA